ncbi:fused MFS/spermidine synthase, partial [bacterium]|nr:fused MFS/spermidine synthase [bacterium]
YEIDPDVIDIALNPDFFSFVKKSNANIKLIQGDGRLCIKKEKNHSFDIIILDAFSSDSIPSHLITLEAIELYKKKLKPGGIIIFHISNRFLNIEPLLAALSEKVNLKFICRFEVALNEEDNKEYRVAANYAVMSQDEIFIGSLSEIDEWRSLKPSDNFKIWTDQYSNLLSILRWSE